MSRLKNFVRDASGDEYTVVQSHLRRRRRPGCSEGMACSVVVIALAGTFVLIKVAAAVYAIRWWLLVGAVIVVGLIVFAKRKRVRERLRRIWHGDE